MRLFTTKVGIKEKQQTNMTYRLTLTPTHRTHETKLSVFTHPQK